MNEKKQKNGQINNKNSEWARKLKAMKNDDYDDKCRCSCKVFLRAYLKLQSRSQRL